MSKSLPAAPEVHAAELRIIWKDITVVVWHE